MTSSFGNSASGTERNPEFKPLFERLCQRVRVAGVYLTFGHESFSQHGEAGSYSPDPWEKGHDHPRIEIFRKVSASLVDDYKAESITLAHEFGHHLSHVSGVRPSDYLQVANRFADGGAVRGHLTDGEAHVIYDEEQRAWDHALRLLEEMGFPDMAAARLARNCGLDNYRERLMLGS